MDIAYHHLETYEGKRSRGRPARRGRDELNDYWKGTIRQRIAQDRQMWKHHANVFIQPHDTDREMRVMVKHSDCGIYVKIDNHIHCKYLKMYS